MKQEPLNALPEQEVFVRTMELRQIARYVILCGQGTHQIILQQAWIGNHGSKEWRDIPIITEA